MNLRSYPSGTLYTLNNANLLIMPAPIPSNGRVLIIGDLHANALKFLWELILHSRFSLSNALYNEAAKIYYLVDAYCKFLRQQRRIDILKSHVHLLIKIEEIEAGNKILADNNFSLKLFQEMCEKYMDGKFADITNEFMQNRIARFVEIVASAVIVSRDPIIMVGDDLRDRGSACNLIIPFYKKFTEAKIPFKIVYSNHLLRFLEYIESDKSANTIDYNQIPGMHNSFANMTVLIQMGIINEMNVKADFLQYVSPNIVTAAYVIDTESALKPIITRWTHGKTGLTTDKYFAEDVETDYDISTYETFAHSLDLLNAGFQNIYVKEKLVFNGAMVDTCDNKQNHLFKPSFETPLLRYAWSREDYETHDKVVYLDEGTNINEENDLMPHELNGFYVQYGHGHDGRGEVPEKYKHIINLDNNFGLGMDTTGDYRGFTIKGRMQLSLAEVQRATATVATKQFAAVVASTPSITTNSVFKKDKKRQSRKNEEKTAPDAKVSRQNN